MANTISELETAIQRYQTSLATLEKQPLNLTKEQFLEILVARDAVQENLSQKNQVSTATLTQILEFDKCLKKHSDLLSLMYKLSELRKTFNPSEDCWWWYLEKLPAAKKPYTWLIELLSLGFLLGTTSLLTSIHPRFAVGGIDPLEALGMLSQSGLTLLVAGGSLTKTGQKTIEHLLDTFKLPKSYQSEVSCGLSALVFLSSLGLNYSLPDIAQSYYKTGQKSLEKGALKDAQNNIEQALALDPAQTKYHLTLGEVYEGILQFENAASQYQIALAGGNNTAFNNLGRLSFYKQDFAASEALFRAGLETANNDPHLHYVLLKNLGWTLLKQNRYHEAKNTLHQAIEIDKQQPEQERDGLAYCILADVLEKQKANPQTIDLEKQQCLTFSSNHKKFKTYDWYIHTRQRYEAFEGQKQSTPDQSEILTPEK